MNDIVKSAGVRKKKGGNAEHTNQYTKVFVFEKLQQAKMLASTVVFI